MSAPPPAADDFYYRLVLWNIGLTLLDVARVNRAAYAEAFRAVTGRPLVQVPQMAGRTDSETFFEALAVYAKGGMLLNARGRAAEKYRADFTEHTTVYIADSTRDVEAAGMGGARSI